MPSRPRHLLLGVLLCVLGAVSLPSAALAHGFGHYGFGHYRGGGHYRHAGGAQQLCAEAGVPLYGQVHGEEGHSLASLSESQLDALKSACEKLAPASAAEKEAVEAASKVLHEALSAARTKLDEACPTLKEDYGPGGWMELSASCKEALKAAGSATREAEKAFGKSLEEAFKAFQPALSAFEAQVKPILETLESAQRQDPQGGSWPALPGFRGARGGAPCSE